jgi:hypothetical protein
MVMLVLVLIASRGWAHPISVSSVAVNVREDKVLANMKIMLEDLVLYHQLTAGPEQRCAADDLKQAADIHQQFLLQYFTIHDVTGHPVPGQVLRLDISDIPAAGVPSAELVARNVFYHFAFPLSPRQEFLIFTQTFGGADAVLPAVTELVVFHHGVLLQRPVDLMQGKPHTVRLDWENPPTQSALGWQEYQQHQQEELRQQLGITSYSGVYSFIYITDQEVRHEILMPLLTLEKWLPLARVHTDFFDVAEQEAARETIATFFRDRNPVEVDGVAVKPVVTRLQSFGLDINDFAQQAQPRRVSMYQARLGIILSYATKSAPTQVHMTWNTFNVFAPFLRSVIFVHDQEPQIQTFEKAHPHFTWTRTSDVPQPALSTVPQPRRTPFWSLPLISIGAGLGAALWLGATMRRRSAISRSRRLLGCGALFLLGGLCWPIGRVAVRAPSAVVPSMTDAEARDLSLALLRNIYRAFDYRNESEMYDMLAQSVDGRLLEALYLQMQKGLQMQEQGSAVARVKAVELVDHSIVASEMLTDGLSQWGFQCRWQVMGTVEHWGHIHTRVNEYEAVLTVRATPEAWKITEYEVLNERRVRFETGLRSAKRTSQTAAPLPQPTRSGGIGSSPGGRF